MTAARGVVRIDLSPFVDEQGWTTTEAFAHVWPDDDVTAVGRLVEVDLGRTRRVDSRLVDLLVEVLDGATVQVVGTYTKAASPATSRSVALNGVSGHPGTRAAGGPRRDHRPPHRGSWRRTSVDGAPPTTSTRTVRRARSLWVLWSRPVGAGCDDLPAEERARSPVAAARLAGTERGVARPARR